MRHRVEGRKFGREKDTRNLMMKNLVKSMIEHGQLKTTLPKAKELRGYVERVVTYGKKDTVHSRRLAYKVLGDRTLVKKLFNEIAPAFEGRNGGYTRVLKAGFRKGDNAPMAIIQFVEESTVKPKKDAIKAKDLN
ncbi:50S ribosomal protein L17 [Candidatus Cloacimonas acidaminovorans]|uniref:Large ribosomal subunit protein bL17 n=1 Tax=Cloacimonas acidaminovorans (strain Evry) TaxID=459349 RepID=B0VI03_CLOAI|nr:50S ribosomal protein L17 [Candidatus Cloacimonas acidaminovorans]CAO80974.1 50S ribosomal subunit protein L17 [Candidatus Cloacimonas acidaminovorans str. Evry]